MSPHEYPGTELELFQNAVNWKRYYARALRPYIRGDVLEVGAGIGGTTEHLCNVDARSWTGLEPDERLLREAARRFEARPLAVPLRLECGTLRDLPASARFDTILYIDVLEHIEDDRTELHAAASCLAPRGHLAVLSPAHMSLYSEFDRAVGHCRRYIAADLVALTPAGLRLIMVTYLDSLGALLSLANRALLKQRQPTASQIALWDRWLLPMSRICDPILGRVVGRSILAVWQQA